jgi:hypothetical protein
MNGLERVTVNLVPPASKALVKVIDLTGLSKTDTVNRAVQLYAFVEDIIAGGGEVLVREKGRDDLRAIVLI